MKKVLITIGGVEFDMPGDAAAELWKDLCKKKDESLRLDNLKHGFVLSGHELTHSASEHSVTRLSHYLNSGNWRSTREGVEREVAYRRALQRIRTWKAENCEAWVDNGEGTDIVFITWNRYTSNLQVNTSLLFWASPIGFFNPGEDAHACITACHDDLLTVIRDGYK